MLAELRDPAYYRYKYTVAGCASVAYAGSRLVGMTAGTPRSLTIGGRLLLAADLGDLFVDPEYRGRGVFRRLHDSTLSALQARGVELVTVQPGPAAVPALTRSLGYTPLFGITESIGIVDRRLALEATPSFWKRGLLSLLPILRPDQAKTGAVEILAEPPSGLPPTAPAAWPEASTQRDDEWLRVRYGRNPVPYRFAVSRDGHAFAVVVFLTHQVTPNAPLRGWLVDGWSTDPEGLRRMRPVLKAVIDEMRIAQVGIVELWSAQGAATADPLVQAAREIGFVRKRPKKRLLCRRLTPSGLAMEMPPGRGWMFRIGDTDGV